MMGFLPEGIDDPLPDEYHENEVIPLPADWGWCVDRTSHSFQNSMSAALKANEYHAPIISESVHGYDSPCRILPSCIANRFPLELVHQIICNSWEDRGTLLACLRVSWSWYTYAVRLLYEPIHIFDRTQLVQLAGAARTHRAVRQRLVNTRTVLLVQSEKKPRFTHIFPIFLRMYLPNLQHVYFLRFLSELCNPGFFTMLPHFAFVTHLLLFDFSFSTFNDFRRMICALPRLEKLELRSGGLQPRTASVYTGPSELATIPSFTEIVLNRVESRFADALVQWMMSHDIRWNIRSLEIAHDFFYHPEFGFKPKSGIIDDLFDLSASTAEHVCLQDTGNAGGCPYRFAMFTRLRSLEVHFSSTRIGRSVTSLARRVHDILSSISCSTLERISFCLDLTGLVCAAHHNMAEIQPLMEEATDNIHGEFVERSKMVTKSSVFSRLSLAKVMLHFRCNTALWDPSMIKGAAENFLTRFLLFFSVWDARGILILSCDTPAGPFTLPRSPPVIQVPRSDYPDTR